MDIPIAVTDVTFLLVLWIDLCKFVNLEIDGLQ